MNNEQFEAVMQQLENHGGRYAMLALKLRARDTAQREAQARVEAERDSAQLSVELWKEQYQSVVDCGNEIMAERDAAQARLAEAVGLLRRLGSLPHAWKNDEIAITAFLKRHAQAEQQEAPDAQLDKDARIALLERELDRTRDRADMAEVELQHARAARATQPAAGEPIGKIVSFGPKLHEVAWSKGKLPPLGTELYAAPPAAAHGDEMDRDEVQMQCLRDLYESGYNDGQNNPNGYSSISQREDAAQHTLRDMRAQAGEGGE